MIYRFGECLLDLGRRTLSRSGAAVPLEPQVFDLIALLAAHPDRVVTRDEIVEHVWGGRIVSESAISARIAAARKAVGDDGKRQAVIRTVARRGLQMVAEVTLSDVRENVATPEAAPLQPEIQRIRYVRLPSGHSLAYAVIGKGPPVIMVEHGRSDIEAEWQLPFERARLSALAEHCTLIRFDFVGTGQSGRNSDRIAVAEQAEDIGALADALGLDQFAMASHSGGCNPLFHYAAQNPDRVTRIAVTGGYAQGRSVRGATPPPTEAEPLRAMLSQTQHGSEDTFFNAVMMAYQPEGPLEAVHAFSRIVLNAASPEYHILHRDVSNTVSNLELLHKITCPTLIFHSRHDAVHPLSEARKLAAGIPNAELVVLECANHIPWEGNAAYDAYLRTWIDFLKRGP